MNEGSEILDIGDWQRVETTYPTDDAVVAAYVMDSSRLPSDPANQDCSVALNYAIQEAAHLGGGTVYVPAGQYLFTNAIDMQPNVTLRGDWGSVAGTNKTVRGTILKVTYNGNRSFIRMAQTSRLSHLSIWYPNQSLTNVIPYSATIDGSYDGTNAASTGEISIKNVNLVNSYVGFAPQAATGRAHVSGLYGSPLSLVPHPARPSLRGM